MAGYLGRTFVKSHETATRQLQAFFHQPVEINRALAAERVIREISDESERTKAQTALAVSIMTAGAAAPPSAEESVRD